MNRNQYTTQERWSKQKASCACDKECLCWNAEKLSVSCGCGMEAKQYEYQMDEKCCHTEHKHMQKAEPKKGVKVIYTCPMHPEVIRDEPGLCPGCGMALIPKEEKPGEYDISELSHKDHEAAMTNPQMAKKMEADMRRRFWISFLLSIPIFLYSPVGINFFKLNLPTPIPINWLLLILTTPIVFWTGS
ncbi:MAG: heavy metal-binding domain-containing protein, partial [Patescibacteria group bacterium]